MAARVNPAAKFTWKHRSFRPNKMRVMDIYSTVVYASINVFERAADRVLQTIPPAQFLLNLFLSNLPLQILKTPNRQGQGVVQPGPQCTTRLSDLIVVVHVGRTLSVLHFSNVGDVLFPHGRVAKGVLCIIRGTQRLVRF